MPIMSPLCVQILWLVSFHLHFTKSHATSKPVGTCGGSLAPNCRVEEGGAENAVGVLRVKINGGGRLLVLYQYYEAPKAAENLRYFIAKSILEPAQRRQRTGGRALHIYMHAYIQTHRHTCIRIHNKYNICICNAYVCMYVCMYIYIYIHVCVCVCVCVLIYSG